MNPQPGVRKVIGIVKTLPMLSNLTSTEDFDSYLGVMQRKASESG
jgi:hypothetical protein